MESSALVKKRLNQLKKLSENLKQSTNAESQLDLSIVKAIFDISKNLSKQQISVSSPHNTSVQQNNLRKQNSSSNILQHISKFISQPNLSRVITRTQSRQQSLHQTVPTLFPQTTNTLKSIPSQKKLASTHSLVEEQLIYLRQQNCKLQFQLRQMKQQISKFTKKQEMQQQKMYRIEPAKQNIDWNENMNNNSQPYFQLYQQIQLFSTKLQIKSEDYKKIQYSKLPIRLTLDKIMVKKYNSLVSSKMGRIRQLNSERSDSSQVQQFSLSNLKQVLYQSDTCMVLVFSDPYTEDIIRVFLNFQDSQTKHRWDLGIFINFKIINSLNNDKLFQRQRQQRQINKISQIKEPIGSQQGESFALQNVFQTLKQNQLLQQYLSNKQKYIQQQKKLKQIMLQKLQQKKRKPKQLKEQKQVQIKKRQTVQKVKQYKEQQNQKHQAQEKNHQKLKQNQIQLYQSITISMKKQQNQPINQKRQETINNQNQMKQKQIQEQLERIRKQEQEQKIKQQQKKKIQNAIRVVKKGMYMTKYSKGALKPHEKKVFISADDLKLCWQDKDSSQYKFVLVSEVQSVQRGEVGPGVLAHLDKKKIKNLGCFLMINLNSKQRKTLQFSMPSLKLMQQFSESLLIFLSELRRKK